MFFAEFCLLLALTGGSTPTPVQGSGHALNVIEHVVRTGDSAILLMTDGAVHELNPAPDTAALVALVSSTVVSTIHAEWKDAAGVKHAIDTPIYDNDDADSIARKEKLHDTLLRSQQNRYPPVP